MVPHEPSFCLMDHASLASRPADASGDGPRSDRRANDLSSTVAGSRRLPRRRLVALAVMVFWGATPVLTRIATDDLDPLWVAVLRTVLAGVVAAPLVVTTERRPPSTARARLLLVVSAAAGFVIFPVVFTIGQERTSAMHGVGILAALPVFTGLYGMLVARRRPGHWWLAGCALALAGEAVIVAVRAGGGGTATLVGDLLVLASALVVSAGYVAGALLVPRGFSSAATTYWGVMLGAVALVPLALVLLAVQGPPRAGAASWAAVALSRDRDLDRRLRRLVLGSRPRRDRADRTAPVPPAALGPRAGGAAAGGALDVAACGRRRRGDRRSHDRPT